MFSLVILDINLVNIRPERTTKKDNELITDLDYKGIEFPVSKKDFSKIEVKNKICINVLCYENKLTYPVYISDQKFKNSMDLLMISNENKSNYEHIKGFERFVFSETKSKKKKIILQKLLIVF